ncbi:hypothetical protein [Aquamicrobium sp.]|uniref:hypothetical protein n=1 Tax=Aquamicrobium sp. TaxID=1872579 RepID=UPI0025845881|nr:hypothetical protein [Aquamicrobium sp.]MCK9549481.1 hypothetical protein [Aquamicrobium sp.]
MKRTNNKQITPETYIQFFIAIGMFFIAYVLIPGLISYSLATIAGIAAVFSLINDLRRKNNTTTNVEILNFIVKKD